MLVVGVDVGSTAVKAGVVRPDGTVESFEAVECTSVSIRPGWVEQDPEELWRAVCTAIAAAVRPLGATRTRIRALAMSVQRGTVIPVDSLGRPIYPAVSWQDLRAQTEWAWLAERLADEFERTTGLYPSAFWTLAKLAWLAHREPSLWRRAHQFLFVHGYLVKCFGSERAVEDPTNASFSGLLDGATRQWSERILGVLRLEPERLGVLRAPGSVLGGISQAAADSTGLPPDTLLVCGAGDQQAVALGAGVVGPGAVAVNIGTAGVVLSCSAHRPPRVRPAIGYLAHAIAPWFQVEGMLGSAGSVLRWLATLTTPATGAYGSRIDRSRYQQMDVEAASVPPGSNGLVVVPDFSGPQGLGDVRGGSIVGLSLSHGRATMARAIMEGIAFEVRHLLGEFLERGIPVRNLIACGGGAQSRLWNQIQADVYRQPVTTLACSHAGVLGAAVLAATGAGQYEDLRDAVRHMCRPGATIDPGAHSRLYDDLFRRYQQVGASLRSMPAGGPASPASS